MKKSEKIPAKPGVIKKTGGGAKKSRSNTPRKRKKTGDDAIRAVLLTGVLIAAAAFFSMTAIIVHSTLKGGFTPKVQAEQVSVPESSSIPEKPESLSSPASAPTTEVPAKPAVVVPTANQPAAIKPVPVAKPIAPVPAAKPAPVTPSRPAASTVPANSVSTVKPASQPVATVKSPSKQPQNRGTVVFIIDDAGNNLRELEPFLRFPGPLTIAVLPGLPHSAEAARLIRAAGKEVFLHQPMEAIGGQAPGPGAIYSEMNADEIRAVLKRNSAEIGPIAGMNNHQGSKITMNEQAMITVLSFCREQGLYFLDSRTTAETAAPAVAKRLGMAIGERDVFIDNEQNRTAMIRYINEGLTRLYRQDSVVMIGHTWSPELGALLAEQYLSLSTQGYSFATASAFIGEHTK